MRSLAEMDRIASKQREQSDSADRAYLSDMDRIAAQKMAMQSQNKISPKQAYGQGIENVMESIPHGIINTLTEKISQPADNRIPQSAWTKPINLPEGQSIGDKLRQAFQGARNIQNERFSEAYRQHPRSASWGTTSGEILKSLPALGAGYRVAQAAPELPYILRAFQGLGKGAIGGGTAGGLYGLIEDTPEGKSTIQNALERAMEGAGYGALAGSVIQGGKALAKGIQSANISPLEKATRVLSKADAEILKHNNQFEKIFSEAENAAIKSKPGKIKDIDTLYKKMGKTDSTSLKDYLNPKSPQYGNPRAANQAQSDLGDLIRDLQKEKKLKGRLSGGDKDLLKSAQDARNKILAEIEDAFQKSGREDLTKEYSAARKSYRENVIPYKKASKIQDYRQKELTEEDLVKSLKNNKLFKATKGQEAHPELYTSDLLSEALKNAIPLGLLGGYQGVRGLYEYLNK